MLARRAARELALILFSQLNDGIENYKNKDFNEIIIKSLRTLTDSAFEDLQISTGALTDMAEFIENYETDHTTNLSRPIESDNVPVPIPLTSDMAGRINEVTDTCEKAFAALEIAEMTVLEEKSDTKKYIKHITDAYTKNHESIDTLIKKHSVGWDFSRLVKIDKDILRISIAELCFVKEAPVKVVIDEAIELAKKYSTSDSSAFINAILAKVVREMP